MQLPKADIGRKPDDKTPALSNLLIQFLAIVSILVLLTVEEI